MAASVYLLWLMANSPSAFFSLMLTVIRTTLQAKAVRFLHLAFDTTGDIFLAGDQHGNIYAFDMNKNRFDPSKISHRQYVKNLEKQQNKEVNLYCNHLCNVKNMTLHQTQPQVPSGAENRAGLHCFGF